MQPDLHYTHANIDLALLRQRAFNYRWATLPADVIALTAADPDFPVADPIRDAVLDYAKSGVYSYGPHEGLSEFREACARMMRERRNVPAQAAQILPIDSVASAMTVVTRLLMQAGDEAIIFDPVDYLFRTSVEAVGGKVVLVPLDHTTGRPDWSALPSLITPRTRLLGVCSPINPLGVVLSEAELRLLGDFAVAHKLWILNDEIWSDIVFQPHQYLSMAALGGEIAERCITVHGMSKTFGLAGLRVGYIHAPTEELYQGMVKTSQVLTTAGGVATISQIAATAALNEGWPWVDAFLRHLHAQREMAVTRLNAMPGVQCRAPEATYLLFPQVTVAGMDSLALQAHLLEKGRVAVVPGATKFFGPGAEGHLRICFATSREILSEGLDRIEHSLQALNR
ncbi:MAG: pyridoxal phosphate-dependent aminotransferase [Burkholderiales bacterium]|nr:pyridoxal phosphate-dependent aminotransferase [Burkholderiales bacterium]